MDKHNIKLHNYFQDWIETFKKPTLAPVTYLKYKNTHRQIQQYFGDITLCALTTTEYQKAINEYSKTHAKRTTSCFHKHIHACLLDAVDEGIISLDPSRKAIISGHTKYNTKAKYLNHQEWTLLIHKTFDSHSIKDQVIYLSAVTGMRYAEILGLTWADISFENQKIRINKTWDYKYHNGFIPTKNKNSIRSIDIDLRTLGMLKKNKSIKNNENTNNMIFSPNNRKDFYSIYMNRHLSNLCLSLGIKEISFHGLRHTHASILLFKGVSLISVSKRLGHSNVTTTQNIYLHIINEMENRERNLITNIVMDII
ncbi:MAG: site-specific integrase [Lachnospiraceae bacterium]|nr:site-specific integrase [Lachnospiraceae bacterium]